MTAPVQILLLLAAQAAAPPPPDYFPADFATPSVRCPYRSTPQPILTEFQNQWYARHLQAAGEPSLSRAARDGRSAVRETLRFTWLPSFDHPVIIRIETARGRSRLIVRELAGAGGYSPGEIARRVERALTADEDRALSALLTRTQLFAGPPRDCRMGLDGAQWLFEGVNAGGYHFLDRWSPEDGPAREVGTFLLGLTGWVFRAMY